MPDGCGRRTEVQGGRLRSRPATSTPCPHTRLPRYIRGRTGRIERDHGVFAFPDTSAASGTHCDPQHVYSVRFEGSELWGSHANANACVYIDLFDDYLDSA